MDSGHLKLDWTEQFNRENRTWTRPITHPSWATAWAGQIEWPAVKDQLNQTNGHNQIYPKSDNIVTTNGQVNRLNKADE
jgi:hypothetical protein